MRKTMNIVININHNYVMPAIVMLSSIKAHSNYEFFNVLILCSNLDNKDINEFKNRLGNDFNFLFHIVDLDLLELLPTNNHICKEAYYRCFIFLFLPEGIDRILYVDCDVIVNGDIDDFYNNDVSDYYLIACEDFSISHINNTIYRNLGLSINEKYFNSGLMLFNCNKMRADFTLYERLCQYIKEKEGRLVFHDQDILNGFYSDMVYICDNKYVNFFVTDVFSKRMEAKYKENIVFIHYVDKWKPWNEDYIGYYANEFWDYAEKLGYERITYYNSYKYYVIIRRIIRKVKLEYIRCKNLFFYCVMKKVNY